MYFLLDKLGRQNHPPVTHPEFYYGFVGLALVWQIAFFIIASDPARYRPIMLAAIPEKFIFVRGHSAHPGATPGYELRTMDRRHRRLSAWDPFRDRILQDASHRVNLPALALNRRVV